MANEQKNNNQGSEEIKTQAGNPNDLGTDPSKGGNVEGESDKGKPQIKNEGEKVTEETVAKKQYEELETKLGEQGKEVGEYRDFFKQISPLLDKLDQQPELVQAIIDGKVGAELAKAALEGKVSIKEAEAVSEAHKEVKKEVGEKKYKEMDPEAIEKMVSEKAQGMVEGIEERLKKNIENVEELRTFEGKVNDFINRTPDFVEYTEGIQKWFEVHPDQDDVEVAYHTVKGIALQKKADEEGQNADGEAAKNVAADAGGGASQNANIVEDKKLADELIGGKSNPNVF